MAASADANRKSLEDSVLRAWNIEMANAALIHNTALRKANSIYSETTRVEEVARQNSLKQASDLLNAALAADREYSTDHTRQILEEADRFYAQMEEKSYTDFLAATLEQLQDLNAAKDKLRKVYNDAVNAANDKRNAALAEIASVFQSHESAIRQLSEMVSKL
jgi:hypothetical protein